MLQTDRVYFGMSHSVVVQVGAGRERFAANRTRVRPFAAVYALVRVQRAGRGKSFVALGARVRTFSLTRTPCKHTIGNTFLLLTLYC